MKQESFMQRRTSTYRRYDSRNSYIIKPIVIARALSSAAYRCYRPDQVLGEWSKVLRMGTQGAPKCLFTVSWPTSLLSSEDLEVIAFDIKAIIVTKYPTYWKHFLAYINPNWHALSG